MPPRRKTVPAARTGCENWRRAWLRRPARRRGPGRGPGLPRWRSMVRMARAARYRHRCQDGEREKHLHEHGIEDGDLAHALGPVVLGVPGARRTAIAASRPMIRSSCQRHRSGRLPFPPFYTKAASSIGADGPFVEGEDAHREAMQPHRAECMLDHQTDRLSTEALAEGGRVGDADGEAGPPVRRVDGVQPYLADQPPVLDRPAVRIGSQPAKPACGVRGVSGRRSAWLPP